MKEPKPATAKQLRNIQRSRERKVDVVMRRKESSPHDSTNARILQNSPGPSYSRKILWVHEQENAPVFPCEGAAADCDGSPFDCAQGRARQCTYMGPWR